MTAAAGDPGQSAPDASGRPPAPADGAETAPVNLPPILQSLGRRILIGEVARLVAHEVNNHLQGIIGLADLMEDEIQDPAWKQSLGRIKEQAEQIAALQRNFSILLKAGDEGAHQPVDLADIWRRAEALFHGAWLRRQVTPTVTVTGALPACQGDADGLMQLMSLAMLWHLRSLDRQPKDAARPATFAVTLARVITATGPAVEWLSRDNGAGIPAVMNPAPSPEEHPELYDDLTSFGLVQMVQIVHRHQGRLATQSAADSGLELRITLPAMA